MRKLTQRVENLGELLSAIGKVLMTTAKSDKVEHISGSVVQRIMQFVPIKCQGEEYRRILKLSCKSLAFTSCKSFFKNKKRPLCLIFEEKYFFCYILLTDQISLSGCLYFARCWVICVLQLFVVSNQTVFPK